MGFFKEMSVVDEVTPVTRTVMVTGVSLSESQAIEQTSETNTILFAISKGIVSTILSVVLILVTIAMFLVLWRVEMSMRGEEGVMIRHPQTRDSLP